MDPAQFEQVLLNLVLNARDAMPQGGRITIGIQRESSWSAISPDWLLISVADTGTGIAPDVLTHIFEPFFTTKPAGEGSGLGLASVYGIIQQSGGQISVESEINAGTRFEIRLPIAQPLPVTPTPSAPPIPTGNGTVLLCDDDAAVRSSIQCLLKSVGWTVIATDSAAAALKALATADRKIDVVLCDVMLTDANGFQLANQIRQHHPLVGVVLMTGFLSAEIPRDETVDLQVEILEKPFRIADAVNALRAARSGVTSGSRAR